MRRADPRAPEWVPSESVLNFNLTLASRALLRCKRRDMTSAGACSDKSTAEPKYSRCLRTRQHVIGRFWTTRIYFPTAYK